MPEVTVIITTYNRQPFITGAIDSVLSQTYGDSELIVIDDGSTDNTRDIVGTYGDQVQYFYQENAGISAARNNGIAHASGKYIAFLDVDDIWLPEKLHTQIQYMKHNPDTRICYSGEIWLRNGRQVTQKRVHQKYTGWIFRQCLNKCFISASSVLIHKNIFNDVGCFDESMAVCEDYDLWLRISASHKIGLIETPLIIKQDGHSDQLSHMFWGMDRFRIHAIEKILQTERLNDNDRNAAITILKKKCTILINGYLKRNKTAEAHYFRLIDVRYTVEQDRN